MLYLKTWDFNVARILDRLGEVVCSRGGQLASIVPEKTLKPYKIKHRDSNDEATVYHYQLGGGSISFVLDDSYMSFQYDSSPFCAGIYQKVPLEGGTSWTGDYSVLELSSDLWSQDAFIERVLSKKELDLAAERLLQALLAAGASTPQPNRPYSEDGIAQSSGQAYREVSVPEKTYEIYPVSLS